MTRPMRLRCQAHYWTGPHRDERCRARWVYLLTGSPHAGMLVCGIHARAYLPTVLAKASKESVR